MIRTRDDRDRPIRLSLRRLVWIARAWRGRADFSRRGWVRMFRRLLTTGGVWLGVFGLSLLVVVFVMMLHDFAMGLWLLIISPVASPLLAMALVATRGILGFGGELPRLIRRDMLAARRCPVCGYDIASLPREPDACITCPECGAAWNWDAIGDRGGRDPEIVIIR